jgi:hypothetical protein
MTATSIVRPYPAHLTPVIGTLIAWLETVNLQAVRLPSNEEVLLLDGQVVNLPAGSSAPTQWVIDLARCGKRDLAASLKAIRALGVVTL